MDRGKILFIDDKPAEGNYLEVIQKALPHADILVKTNGKEGLALLKKDREISLVLLDIKMPHYFAIDDEYEGIEVLREIKKQNSDIPVIMVTVFTTDTEKIVDSIKAGAFHYIPKPIDPHYLALQVTRALKEGLLQRDISHLKDVINIREEIDQPLEIPLSARGLGRLVGLSGAMKEVYRKIEKLSKMSRIPVLIIGESGTGKELVAREIHVRSERHPYPFMAFNASDEFNSSDPLIRGGKLRGFGRDSGIKDIPKKGQEGILKKVDRGTLLLDEICEMPLDVQASFLRILQSAEPPEFKTEFFPAAGEVEHPLRVDVRFIFATNKDPREYINQGKIREDFYYRINVASIHLPSLRKRKDDIPLLTAHFIAKFNQKYNLQVKTISPDVEKIFFEYEWPGNVRELENKIEKAMVNAEGNCLKERDFEQEPKHSESSIEFLTPEKLWSTILAGTMKVGDLTDFKRKWGENVLKELIKKAFAKTRSQKEAGRILGCYMNAHTEPKRYSIFRQECTKLGVKIKDFK